MRLMVIMESGFNDYTWFKNELDSFKDLFEVLYFAQDQHRTIEFCNRYAFEEMEYLATPVWNAAGEEMIPGYTLNALYNSIPKVDQVIWFVKNMASHDGDTVSSTYTIACKPIRFVEFGTYSDTTGWSAA